MFRLIFAALAMLTTALLSAHALANNTNTVKRCQDYIANHALFDQQLKHAKTNKKYSKLSQLSKLLNLCQRINICHSEENVRQSTCPQWLVIKNFDTFLAVQDTKNSYLTSQTIDHFSVNLNRADAQTPDLYAGNYLSHPDHPSPLKNKKLQPVKNTNSGQYYPSPEQTQASSHSSGPSPSDGKSVNWF